MERFFQQYVSDTTAAMAVQTLFDGDGERRTARVYVRASHGGGQMSMLFSGTVDTTYADGTATKAGDICDSFEIASLRVGVCEACDMVTASEPSAWMDVTWDGAAACTVYGGDMVATDPIEPAINDGDTLCIEFEFLGYGRIPCHAELQIPSFVKEGDRFVPSPFVPIPIFIGVRRGVTHRVAFLGDSITQGIGATPGAYRHWVARVGERLGGDVACYNLGIGFARCADAAANGAWLARAKAADTVVLCLGVNDILQGVTADAIVHNLSVAIGRLREAGCRVLLQSVPPFEYPPDKLSVWKEVNERICGMGDVFFDNTAFLCDGERPRFGGHPNDDGCAVWADAITPVIQRMIR